MVKDDDRKRRVKHAVTENARTKQAAAALKNGELKTFGELMKEKGELFFIVLLNIFVGGCTCKLLEGTEKRSF